MIDFNDELQKIENRYRSTMISEEQAKYEVRKLHATAHKLHQEWKSNVFTSQWNKSDKDTIIEDCNTLQELYNEKGIRYHDFIRENAKIIALCEFYNFKFPGKQIVADDICINSMSLLLEDDLSSEYEGLEDNDEFEDENEDEPQMESSIALPDGRSLERWIVSSEYEYRINGDTLPYNEKYFVDLLCTQLPLLTKNTILKQINSNIVCVKRAQATPMQKSSSSQENMVELLNSRLQIEKQKFEIIKNCAVDEIRSKSHIIMKYLDSHVWDVVSNIFDDRFHE